MPPAVEAAIASAAHATSQQSVAAEREAREAAAATVTASSTSNIQQPAERLFKKSTYSFDI